MSKNRSMKMKFGLALTGMMLVTGVVLWTSCAQKPAEETKSEVSVEDAKAKAIERGKYLVTVGGCQDCHSPHDAEGKIIAGKELTGWWKGSPVAQWSPDLLKKKNILASIGLDFTTFAGPWGISKAKNLTPDPDTGLGKMTEEEFVDLFRRGKLLPPMPLEWMSKMTDDDLKAIYAYLHSLPPVNNGNVEDVKKADAKP